MATHSSVLSWRIPGTGEPGGLPSLGSHRVGHNWSDAAAANQYKQWVSEVAQSCPTLFDPMDCSLPGSSVHGIFQARVPKWVAIAFSRGSSRPRDQTQVFHIAGRHFTIWATREAPKNRVNRYNVWLVFPSYFAKSIWRSNVKLYPIPNLPQGLLCLRQGNINWDQFPQV